MTENTDFAQLDRDLSDARRGIENFEGRMEALALVTYSLLLSYTLATFIGSLVGLAVFLALGLILLFSSYRRKRHIVHNPMHPDISIDVALDISNPTSDSSPYRREKNLSEEWIQHLGNLKTKLLKEKLTRKIRLFEILGFPIMTLCLTILIKPQLAQSLLVGVASQILNFGSSTSLEIKRGLRNPDGQSMYKIGSSPIEISITPDNLVSFRTRLPADQQVPSLVFSRIDKGGESESFQFFESKTEGDDKKTSEIFKEYELGVTIPYSGQVVLPHLSSKVLATFLVEQDPIPQVSLAHTNSNASTQGPWPDHQAIELKIEVQAFAPLDEVNLIIKSGKTESKELVRKISGEEQLILGLDHSFLPEPYLDEDLQSFELIAEVSDRSSPRPFVGYSEPLIIEVASAYGRYRNTLLKLRETSQQLAKHFSENLKLPDSLAEDLDRTFQLSDDVPFFDQEDRFHLEQFRTTLNEILKKTDSEQKKDDLFAVKAQIDDFLFEHEGIDDRERDRDFFVSLRTYSRLLTLSKSGKEELTSIRKRTADQITHYLKDRQDRWAIRVGRLNPDFQPKSWPKVRDERPFEKAIKSIEGRASQSTYLSSGELSRLSQDYKAWIEELEKAETGQLAEREQSKKNALASSLNQIKELQKAQARISRELDSQKGPLDPEKTADLWPSLRMEQNQNTALASSVEGMLRSVSPLAAKRMNAAKEMMEKTSEKGNSSEFAQAETASDLAGRLLVQADQAAAQASQKQGQGRKRRRVSGDHYYGQTITGGDVRIVHDYEVDSKYRQRILDDLGSELEKDEGPSKALLEDYLRAVIR